MTGRCADYAGGMGLISTERFEQLFEGKRFPRIFYFFGVIKRKIHKMTPLFI